MAQLVAKRWSINAVSRADKPLVYFKDGFPFVPGAAGSAVVSPVEYLLIAAAACLALSVRSVIAARGLPKGSFEVIATGEKARDPPNRLDRLSMVVLFESAVDESQAASIVAEAKKLCTVTNTITGTPDLNVRSRTTAAPPSAA